MKLRSVKYFVHEGTKSFFRNGLMSLASVIIVTACLIIFGIYVLFSLNLNYIMEQVKEQYEIAIFIDSETDSEDVGDIGEKIKENQYVLDAEFVSKDDALKDYKKQLGVQSTWLDGLENDNPLRDSYQVTLSDLSVYQEVVEEIEKIEGVAYIRNNHSVIEKIVSITGIIKNISFWVMIFLAAIAVFIISNTIRLTVFARRKEVNIMKFVGATNNFISWPFIVEGMIIGIVGAAISLALISYGYIWFISGIGAFLSNSFMLYKLGDIIWIVTGSLLALGIFLGAIGSAVSLRKHLHV